MILILASWIGFNLIIVLVALGAYVLHRIAQHFGHDDPLELLWALPPAERNGR